jgi:ubiquinone/menaquinone biosynthesis C-methylase UbiE
VNKNTSWDKIGKWYGGIVQEKGHYYHQSVILPNLKRLMNLAKGSRVMDVGCGQGVLGREVGPEIDFVGIDLATNLINEARELDKSPKHQYLVGDATGKLPAIAPVDCAVMLLALQNMEKPFVAIRNVSNLMKKGGKLVLVLNHPAFRIPKNADWGVDIDRKRQYRKVYKYMTPLRIPIDSSPFDKKDNQVTWSFHYPISSFVEMLTDNGMMVAAMEEWISDKKSTGSMAIVEDEARKEIPLFLAIVAVKI